MITAGFFVLVSMNILSHSHKEQSGCAILVAFLEATC